MRITTFVGLTAATLPLAHGVPVQGPENEPLHPDILHAMKRDLGLDAPEAHARIAREVDAADTIDMLTAKVGDKFAGAWLEDDGATINVAVTDEASAAEIKAAGAKPVVVSTSLSRLEAAKAALDNVGAEAETLVETQATKGGNTTLSVSSDITGWHVDVAKNKLIVTSLSTSRAEAEALAARLGLTEAEFEIETVDERPTTLADTQIWGGDAFYINGGARCSIGFSTLKGFITAGHCHLGGTKTTHLKPNGPPIGTISKFIFPGRADMAFVPRPGPGVKPQGGVRKGNGDLVAITGHRVAAIGAAICRTGSTTGTHCGKITSRGNTVNYSQGKVTGLTGTNACAEPGDSGGPFYSGGQAQGVVSGGSGNCKTGGKTFFQPLNEIINEWKLSLVVKIPPHRR